MRTLCQYGIIDGVAQYAKMAEVRNCGDSNEVAGLSIQTKKAIGVHCGAASIRMVAAATTRVHLANTSNASKLRLHRFIVPATSWGQLVFRVPRPTRKGYPRKRWFLQLGQRAPIACWRLYSRERRLQRINWIFVP